MASHMVVVGVGFCPVDEIIVVPSYPAIGTKISSSFVTRQGGGAVATGLVLLSTLGIGTRFVSKVGDDDEGRFLIEIMRQKGVNCDAVYIAKGEATSRTIIIVDSSSGKATIITPENRSFENPLGVYFSILEQTSVLHLDGHLADDALKLAQVAKRQGVLVSLNTGRARPGIEKLLEISDIIITSKSFALERYSCSVPEEALLRLRNEYQAQIIGITLQDQGAICWSKDAGLIRSKVVPVNVRDESGAGDIFHGAFLYGILNSWPLQRTLEFANASAAYSCQFYGGRGGVPNSEQAVWEFLAQKSQQ